MRGKGADEDGDGGGGEQGKRSWTTPAPSVWPELRLMLRTLFLPICTLLTNI